MPDPFRILSLDGGGSWALIQVRALQKIYGNATQGHDILKDFNLVAANSGGSLVLGGLVENRSLVDILNMFLDPAQRSRIFAPLSPWEHIVDTVLEHTLHVGPKYSTSRKLIGIQMTLKKMGGEKLNTLTSGKMENGKPWPKLLITAFDYDLRRASFFRSDTASLAAVQPSASPTLAEAIHASTNAPVNYFDQPAEFPGNIDYMGKRYWDGGIGGNNNPVLAAVIEALANKADAASIHALAIGTATVSLPSQGTHSADNPALVLHRPTSGLTHDIMELAKSILADPPDAASYATHVLLGGSMPTQNQPSVSGHIIRMNPVIRPVLKEDTSWTLPDGLSEDEFEALVAMDMDAVDQSEVDLIESLCTAWINGDVPNQAIRADADFRTLIGHDRFAAAAAAWRDL